MNFTNATRKARVALTVVAVSGAALLAPISAHAAGGNVVPTAPYAGTTNSGAAYGYVTGDGNTDGGVTSQVTTGGNTVDQASVRTDYGQIANIFLARFTPALVVIGISGAVLLAAGGAVSMVHGRLRSAFHG